ncbi:MAG TPA: HD domain-containing protein [Ignavibacteriaceae bacterium]
MSENNILIKIESYVKELFKNRSAAENIYHNILHTTEVVNVAAKIAESENLSAEDTEILLIAAWFHDTGYFHCCKGHEEQSSEYARDYLVREGYPEEKILRIIECIKATQIPHAPTNKLEEIICDADLHHLGMIDIKERGELLRKEFEMNGLKKLSDIEWLKNSLNFFNKHHFFTEYAKRKFGVQKNLNILKMKEQLEILEGLNN